MLKKEIKVGLVTTQPNTDLTILKLTSIDEFCVLVRNNPSEFKSKNLFINLELQHLTDYQCKKLIKYLKKILLKDIGLASIKISLNYNTKITDKTAKELVLMLEKKHSAGCLPKVMLLDLGVGNTISDEWIVRAKKLNQLVETFPALDYHVSFFETYQATQRAALQCFHFQKGVFDPNTFIRFLPSPILIEIYAYVFGEVAIGLQNKVRASAQLKSVTSTQKLVTPHTLATEAYHSFLDPALNCCLFKESKIAPKAKPIYPTPPLLGSEEKKKNHNKKV